METLLLLAAFAAVVLAGILIAAASSRARRPELRMQRELDLADGDEEGMIDSLRPVPASPIDRDAPIIDLTPIEDGRPGASDPPSPQGAEQGARQA